MIKADNIELLYCFVDNNKMNVSIVNMENSIYKVTEDDIEKITSYDINNLQSLIVADTIQNKKLYKNTCDFNHLLKLIDKEVNNKYVLDLLSIDIINDMRRNLLKFYKHFINSNIIVSGKIKNSVCELINVKDSYKDNKLTFVFKFIDHSFHDINFEIERTIELKS